jgi:hypothetical protein
MPPTTPAICFVVWTPVTCIRVLTAIDATLEVPIWAYGIAFSIAASEGTFFAIVFSQVVMNELMHASLYARRDICVMCMHTM